MVADAKKFLLENQDQPFFVTDAQKMFGGVFKIIGNMKGGLSQWNDEHKEALEKKLEEAIGHPVKLGGMATVTNMDGEENWVFAQEPECFMTVTVLPKAVPGEGERGEEGEEKEKKEDEAAPPSTGGEGEPAPESDVAQDFAKDHEEAKESLDKIEEALKNGDVEEAAALEKKTGPEIEDAVTDEAKK